MQDSALDGKSLRSMSRRQLLMWGVLHPVQAAERATRKILYPALLRTKKGLIIGSGADIKGLPHIEIHDGATIVVGCNVTLNSWNANYHVNMHSGVKLLASMSGASIEIGDDSRIHGACIHATRSVRIGKKCLIAANTQIFDANGHDSCFPAVEDRILTRDEGRPIEIEDNVWVGISSIVLPGVKIGTGSIVAAASVVTRDVPPFVIVAGNPARIVKDQRELLDHSSVTS